MPRRRNPNKVALTSLAILVDVLETILKLKLRRETYDHLVKRLVAEWHDLKDYRLDMDQVLRLKDKQISRLEYELKEKLNQQRQQHP
jgi:hypothetical protein